MPLYSDHLMQTAHSRQFENAVLKNYLLDQAYDEMFAGPGDLHKHCEPLLEHFASLPVEELQRRKQSADLSFLNQGITFTVYGRDEGTEQIFPYDLLPRSFFGYPEQSATRFAERRWFGASGLTTDTTRSLR